ncbi:DUF2637 domain-containing protein [Streptomyces sp. enrichment culture]|uniref:DUF2637 domain-containing protein n=1 Tax=Streptomyces sp. enrichment culture TaxID=1795815 RepID=UPI003F57F57E
MHRVLIGVVVFGAVIIAGIGFAGSYAAVRELALKKGFGDFSYVFPIGIDAGICVLLALDLLLTWIRIPFPLLRQTAWLLTAATIAFNGAAAWPDPLGVGMHAVIPVLFVVAVEAARHAVGRIADITADKHMEGVRLTRWLLSPIPTFLLWRRMKLWELRSYDQVIKLEQERLVYQARLRSRFGRFWRRKAPVESLMPLRLARYGVPLAETAPAGLAAAGIEPALIPPAPQPALEPAGARVVAGAAAAGSRAAGAAPVPQGAAPLGGQRQELAGNHDAGQPATGDQPAQAAPRPLEPTDATVERFADAYASFVDQFQIEPTAAQWAFWLRDTLGLSTATGAPLSEEQVQPLLQALKERYAPEDSAPGAEQPPTDEWFDYFHNAWRTYGEETGTHPDADELAAYVHRRDGVTGADGAPLTGEDVADYLTAILEREQQAQAAAPADPEGTEPATTPETDADAGGAELTLPDRYYLAWTAYQDEHGAEPSDEQLSAYLAEQGLLGRAGKPVGPSSLRRHFLRWRVYGVWASYRTHVDRPSAEEVARACTARGITAQYNRPVAAEYIAQEAADFERRWLALAGHRADAQP